MFFNVEFSKNHTKSMSDRLERLMTFIFSFLFTIGCATPTPSSTVETWMDLQGHRGARGNRPENTKSAFRYAFDEGMDTIELDTALTADGFLVIHHDINSNPDLCLNSNGILLDESQPIRSLKLETLQTYNCGAMPNPKFPNQQLSEHEQLISLEEFFVFIQELQVEDPKAQRLRFNIELKFPENPPTEDVQQSVKRAITVIQNAGMNRRSNIQSFHLDALKLSFEINPEIERAALFMPTKGDALTIVAGGSSKQREILKKSVDLGVNIISPHHIFVDQTFVSEAHTLGMKVIPWTVNEKKRMLELMKFGVDGIISDYPKILKEAYQEYKGQ